MSSLSERQRSEEAPATPRVEEGAPEPRPEQQGEEGGLGYAAYRTARKLVVALLGVSLLLVGVAMIVLPGPAFVVIPMGLGILSLEFAWARRWLRRARAMARRAASATGLSQRKSSREDPVSTG